MVLLLHPVAVAIFAVHDIDIGKHLENGLSVILFLRNFVVVDLQDLQLGQLLQVLQVAHRGYLVVVQCQEVYLRAVAKLVEIFAGESE